MKIWVLSAAHLISMAIFALGGEVPESVIEGLSSESFKERELSQTELLAWAEEGGKAEISSIYSLSKNSDDPEVSQRCLKVLKELSDQDYLSDGQGYLGIGMEEKVVNLAGDDKPRICILITRVVADSPADLSGMRPGDLITELDGEATVASNEFMQKIANSKPLKVVVLTIKRKNENSQEVEVRLGKRPVENLSGINLEDLKLLDRRAREKHFNMWLEVQEIGE